MAADNQRGLGRARAAAGGLALGAATVWASSRLTWVAAQGFDDKAGEIALELTGGQWATELTVVALILLVAALIILTVRRTARRVIAIGCAVLAAVIALPPVSLLVGGASPERVRDLLTANPADAEASQGNALASWAELTEVQTIPAGPAVAILGACVALVAALLIACRPGQDPVRRTRFEKASQRRAQLDQNLADDPNSGRVMWDALDTDVDPTEVGPGDLPSENINPR